MYSSIISDKIFTENNIWPISSTGNRPEISPDDLTADIICKAMLMVVKDTIWEVAP